MCSKGEATSGIGSRSVDLAAADDDATWRPGRIERALARPAVWLIIAYRLTLSPFLGGQCRFVPTCSEYALTAYRRFGVRWGTMLTVRRLARCQPFCKGGYDPVPWERPRAARGESG